MSRHAKPDHHVPDKLVTRDIELDGTDLINVRRGLLRVADVLYDFAAPDLSQKSAPDIPLMTLDPQSTDNATTRVWAPHTAMSVNYSKTANGEDMSLSFISPQEYDKIDVRYMTENGWHVSDHRNPIMPMRQNIFTNRDLLRVIDAKTPHNRMILEFLPRASFLVDAEFPSELADTLLPLSKKRTETKTFQAVESRTTPSFHVPTLNIHTPEYTSDVVAEITRADGVRAVDYSMRIAYSGLPVTAGYSADQDANIGEVASVFEHGFRVPYGEDKIEDTSTTFTVIGTPNIQNKKLKQFVEDETADERAVEYFRKGVQMVLDKHGIIRPYDSEF